MSAGTATPRGIGVYYSREANAWSPREAAREVAELREMRAAYAVLCVEATAQDGLGWRADHGVLVSIVEHLREAGVAAGVYALPSRTAWLEPEALADRMIDAAISCGARLIVPDVEEQANGMERQVERFFRRLFDRISEKHSVMVTFYGKIPRKPRLSRNGFPWAAIVGKGACGYQLYKTAENDDAVDARMADAAWHWGADVVPHLATYLGDAARLRGDLERTCTKDGRVIVPGVCIWQKSTTSAAERRALAEFAERAGW